MQSTAEDELAELTELMCIIYVIKHAYYKAVPPTSFAIVFFLFIPLMSDHLMDEMSLRKTVGCRGRPRRMYTSTSSGPCLAFMLKYQPTQSMALDELAELAELMCIIYVVKCAYKTVPPHIFPHRLLSIFSTDV